MSYTSDQLSPHAAPDRPAAAELYVSLELSLSKWLVTSLLSGSGRMSKHILRGGDGDALLRLIAGLKAKAQRQAGTTVSVVAIQEAGLDGFSLHRLLEGEGIESWVVDPASVAVSRRMRRAKSDGIDGHTNRIKGLLMSQGMRGYNPLGKNRHACLETLSTPQGRPLPPRMKAEIRRELERLDLLARQIKQVEAERDALAVASPKAVETPAVLLMNLKGVGPETATLLWLEGLFRTFANRRQLAAFAGLAPTPWLSGRIQREQGISKSGNPRVRTAMVELAWLWLRNQPDSALSRWFVERVRAEGGRKRKITIVALARKLLVALWRYVTHGEVPKGAVLKTA